MKRKPGHPHYSQPQWLRTRKLVLMRDNWQCQLRGPYCKGIADRVDHILPRSKGGSDSLSNLVASCNPCNSSKGDSLISPVVTVNW